MEYERKKYNDIVQNNLVHSRSMFSDDGKQHGYVNTPTLDSSVYDSIEDYETLNKENGRDEHVYRGLTAQPEQAVYLPEKAQSPKKKKNVSRAPGTTRNIQLPDKTATSREQDSVARAPGRRTLYAVIAILVLLLIAATVTFTVLYVKIKSDSSTAEVLSSTNEDTPTVETTITAIATTTTTSTGTSAESLSSSNTEPRTAETTTTTIATTTTTTADPKKLDSDIKASTAGVATTTPTPRDTTVEVLSSSSEESPRINTTTTSLSTTTMSTTTTTMAPLSIADICQTYDGLIPHPVECQVYYNCSYDVPIYPPSRYEWYMMECPYPQLFSTETMSCEHFEKVTCGNRTEAKDGYTYLGLPQFFSSEYRGCVSLDRIPSNHGGIATNCTGRPDGYYPNEYGKCNIYTECRWEHHITTTKCPEGQAFDEVTKSCSTSPSTCICSKSGC